MVTDNKDKFEGYDPEYYDLTFSEQKFDVPFYTQLAKEVSGRVLEVACGSGRVYLDLLKEDIDIYGIDLSEKMLAALKEKAGRMGLEPKVYLADMRDFELDTEFDLIIIPARSFLHNITTDDQLKTLKSCYKHLAENGRLALNFFCPNYKHIEEIYGKEISQLIETPDGQIEVIKKSYFADEVNQIIEVLFTWKKGNSTLSRLRAKLSSMYRKEFELLLSIAGFARWQIYGGFEYQTFESPDQEMVWIVEK